MDHLYSSETTTSSPLSADPSVGHASVPTSMSADDDALMKITRRPAAVMVRGAGSYLWDQDGNRYLDFVQGWAVNALGHCPSEVSQALAAQSQTLISPSPAFHNRPQRALATHLSALAGGAQVHFANSGAEANEAAVKLARKWGQRHRHGAYEVVTTEGAFHGRTLAMMAASGKPGWDALFPPVVPGFVKVPFDDLGAIEAAIGPRTAAVMLEPIQGEAGVVVPRPGYLSAVREIADRHQVLLILDEIQTGVGRTGTFFAAEHEGVTPDILTLAKGLGGGLPISAVLAQAHASGFEPGDQGGTYNGNPLVCAVAARVVDTVAQPGFLADVRARAEQLSAGLRALGAVYPVSEVRGCGLLWALELPTPVAETVVARAMAVGLLINAPRATTLRLMPSLRVSEVEVDAALGLMREVLESLAP